MNPLFEFLFLNLKLFNSLDSLFLRGDTSHVNVKIDWILLIFRNIFTSHFSYVSKTRESLGAPSLANVGLISKDTNNNNNKDGKF